MVCYGIHGIYHGIHGILSDVHLPCFPEDPAAITLRFSKQLMADSKDGKASGLPCVASQGY